MTGDPARVANGLVLLDSVIIIDHLNGSNDATTYLATVAERSLLSPITRAEVLAGVEPPDDEAVRQLLDRFHCVSIDPRIADLAAELRRTWKWRLPDAFQAAVALSVGGQLATRNTRDFNPSIHRFVIVPYTSAP